jgi:uncharacterized protein (TIGR03435 family)
VGWSCGNQRPEWKHGRQSTSLPVGRAKAGIDRRPTCAANGQRRACAARSRLCAMRIMLTLVLGTTVAFAQTAPSFELVAIRENTSGASGGSTRIERGGRWIATNISLASLITIAHGLNNDDRVLNAPEWTRRTRYDINAAGTPDITNADVPSAIRSLLRERFRLQAHVEQRELPTYNLTMLRPDGRLGPEMTPAGGHCRELAALRATDPAAANAAAANAPASRVPCGIRHSNGGTLIEAGGITAGDLAIVLSGPAGRPVIDKTGLAGLYDVQLHHSGPDPAAATDVVSVFTAVQEQLGLRLENGTAPLDVVVVDSVSRPTPN